jgi:hypothetical protein
MADSGRLEQLAAAMVYEKITVSYAVETRDVAGVKRSVFYSVNASKPDGFDADEVRLARLVLGKHVVAAVYQDAVLRRVMDVESAANESAAVQHGYDERISRLLEKT